MSAPDRAALEAAQLGELLGRFEKLCRLGETREDERIDLINAFVDVARHRDEAMQRESDISDALENLRAERDAAVEHADTAQCDIRVLRAEVAARAAEIDNAREYLWFNHGHEGVYGDDGEMQCGRCGAGHHDYKRDPFPEVVERAVKVMHGGIAALTADNERLRAALETAARQIWSLNDFAGPPDRDKVDAAFAAARAALAPRETP